MKALNEVIEEEKAELRKKWPPFEVEGDHEQYSEGIFVSDIESLEDHLTQAMNKAALAVVEELLEKTYMAEFTPYDVARAVRAEDIETIRKQLTDKE